MNSWSQGPQLQLEQEYDLDPAQFNLLGTDPTQRSAYPHRPAPAPYPQQYSEGYSAPFSFSAPQTHNVNLSYDPPPPLYPGNPTMQAQRTQQLIQNQDNVYGGPSHIMQHQHPTPAASALYHDDARPYPYHTQVQQGLDAQHHNALPHAGPTPTSRDFHPLDVNTAVGTSQSVYTSSPVVPLSSQYSSPPDLPSELHGSHLDSSYVDLDRSAFDPAYHNAKRPRVVDDGYNDAEGGVDGDGQGKGDPSKRAGACARCKGLKVRCEFIDPDTCKRCMNGGHECVIPGRKKRRPPPKREVLLNQIRDQAAQIENLISQLEEARKADRRRSAGHAPAAAANAPMDRRPSITLSPSELAHPDITLATAGGESGPDADVEDWIAKARKTIEAFGGYINMGDSSATMDMLGESGESSDGSDPAYEGEDDEEGEGEGEPSEVTESITSLDSPSVGRGRGQYFSRESTESVPENPHRRGHGGGAPKLATLPHEAAPFGLMANMLNKARKQRSRRSSISRSEASADDTAEVGLANGDYFRPSPAPERPMPAAHQPPHILRNGRLKPDEVEKLFSIYFDYMNLSCSLLDPVLYTAQKTFWRSPFLFTVICAVASRHYAVHPGFYTEAMTYARLAAGTALIGGQKSIEIVEAYILLTLYPAPARRWEEDRSWIYLGLAIRLAIDLNLHYPNTPHPTDERHAREMLNRTRVWLNCFNLDRSTGSQYGRAPIIPNSDYVANHTESWWTCSPWNLPGFDIHLCCYNAELKVMGDFRARIYSNPNDPTGINKDADVAGIASETDDHLARLWETWAARIREANFTDRQALFRNGLLKLAFSYARLTVLSVGFQHSFGKTNAADPKDEVPFLWRCLRAALDVVNAVVNEIGIPEQRIYLRHGAEAQSVFVTFASAFLIKLLQPKYAVYITRDQRADMRASVQKVIDLLGSPEVSVDDRHGPKLYARFLEGLLRSPMARLDHSPASMKRNALSPRRPVLKPSSSSSPSASPSSELDNALGPARVRQSLSPPPPRKSASPPVAADAYPSMAAYVAQQHTPPGIPTPPFLAAPLPFDSELLQTMHSLTDVDAWPDMMVIPGFSWMMQSDDPNMKVGDPMVGIMGG